MNASTSAGFQDKLATLSKEHKLVVVEELGFSGPCYRVMSRQDAAVYMALVYNWHPERLH